MEKRKLQEEEEKNSRWISGERTRSCEQENTRKKEKRKKERLTRNSYAIRSISDRSVKREIGRKRERDRETAET